MEQHVDRLSKAEGAQQVLLLLLVVLMTIPTAIFVITVSVTICLGRRRAGVAGYATRLWLSGCMRPKCMTSMAVL